MREYILKRGHFKNIQGQKLVDIVEESFGNANQMEEKITASYGALVKISVWTDGKSLFVDTDMNKDVADDVARDTIAAYNKFLEKATGMSAKERAKKAKKAASG
jgi:hypothetical protein